MNYFLKVWLTTLLVSPFIIFISLSIIDNNNWLDIEQTGPLAFLFILAGIIFSLPSIGLFYLLGRKLQQHNINNKSIKITLSIYAVISIFVTFSLLGDAFTTVYNKDFVFPLSYSIIMAISIFLFNLNFNDHKTSYINKNE
ncbi:hypothetical protein GCM10007424_17830 [Flavobacterium suaedae]|uniref:DUF4293 family protein n=1 Tax=Flavobacterium suaedae TaxID=1767027 RepID=A0ABQ1JU81_9FLAO|nr:hypothetical protein [Flavobacterium suaedae]GGB78164.1 hypothetical protein GCM10007424_17830 [Flavobacterium suaedae]